MTRKLEADISFCGWGPNGLTDGKRYNVVVNRTPVTRDNEEIQVPRDQAYFILGSVVEKLQSEGLEVSHPFNKESQDG